MRKGFTFQGIFNSTNQVFKMNLYFGITYKIGLDLVTNISSTCVRLARTKHCNHGFIWFWDENLRLVSSLLHPIHIRPILVVTTWMSRYEPSYTWHIWIWPNLSILSQICWWFSWLVPIRETDLVYVITLLTSLHCLCRCALTWSLFWFLCSLMQEHELKV
jgi:hypothetical protein